MPNGIALVNRAAEDPARHEAGACAPDADPKGIVVQGPDTAQTVHETGTGALYPADGNGGAGVRADQAGPGIPAVPAAGTGEGEPGVTGDLHRAQPAQARPAWPRAPRQWTGNRRLKNRRTPRLTVGKFLRILSAFPNPDHPMLAVSSVTADEKMREIAGMELTHLMARASFTKTSWRCLPSFAEGGTSERDLRNERGGRSIRGIADDLGIARNTV